MPNHVTVALCSTEIWPFEFCEISAFSEVWTVVIAFLEGNSKIGLRKAVDQIPYYDYQLSVLSSARKWQETDLGMCNNGQLSEVQKPHDLDIDLGSGEGHICMQNTCSTTSVPNSVTVASHSSEIWPFEFCEISTFGEVWTLVRAFVEGNWKIRLPQAVDPGPILSLLTISFDLHTKSGGGVCSYGQLSEVQMLRDLDLELGSGQGHINIHNTCRTTCTPNRVTVASRTTEIWPFECREISTLDEVWTLVIALIEGNLKIGLRQAVVQVPYYHQQPPVISSMLKLRRR